MKRRRKPAPQTPDNRRILYYEERQAVHTPANLHDRATIAKEIDYILQSLQVQGGREIQLGWDAKKQYFVVRAKRTHYPSLPFPELK
jgi:hypothetical protein